MIDWDKPIETGEGLPARVISKDYKEKRELLVVVQIDYEAFSVIGQYTQKGEPKYTSPKIRNRKTKREGWVNIYENGFAVGYYETKTEAEEAAGPSLIATVKIEWEE